MSYHELKTIPEDLRTKLDSSDAEMFWIEDPAHAWLKVPKELFEAYDITASTYSYQDDSYVYLEEDCDATLFIDAAGINDWYIPTKLFPHQMKYGDRSPRDLDRIKAVDTPNEKGG